MSNGDHLRDPAKALEIAERIRKFEIELYWRRSAYFWTFIALAFAGYGALQIQASSQMRYHLSFLLANVGFVASVAWFLANRGSKYWQEQWETHVDTLENNVTGPLYKKQFTRHPECNSGCSLCRWITGPCRISVSKINQIGSFYVVWVWLVLGIRSFLGLSRVHWDSIAFMVLTALVLILFLCCGRTGSGHYFYDEDTRRVRPVRKH